MNALFRDKRLPKKIHQDWRIHEGVDYKYHPVWGDLSQISEPAPQSFVASLEAAFSRVRRNSFVTCKLAENSVAALFDTGDACVLQFFEPDGRTEDVLKAIEERRLASEEDVRLAAEKLTRDLGARTAKFQVGETITHVVLIADEMSETFSAVAHKCFSTEGLSFEFNDKGRENNFVSGWSFSVCVSSNLSNIWDTVGVMARLQCEWYTVRVTRDFCLRTLSGTDLRQSVDQLILHEREIVKYQTELRLWRHRMEEFKANLKPGLTNTAGLVEEMWEVRDAKDYVNDTLAQARDLIETSYSRRMLLQERRQSLMLFCLTALGLLSLASIAAVYWDWMTLAGFFNNKDVATDVGQTIVAVGLSTLFLLLLLLLVTFARIRRRPD